MASVIETVEARLERARAGDPAVFTRLYPEGARAAAEAADARRRAGVSLGPLDGAVVFVDHM